MEHHLKKNWQSKKFFSLTIFFFLATNKQQMLIINVNNKNVN